MSSEQDGKEEVMIQMFKINLQSPSTNDQIITNIETPILKNNLIIRSLEFIWSLEFGYWNFGYFSSLLYSISNHMAKKRD